MKLTLRKVGNSLGVLIPKSALDRWMLKEGDSLLLTQEGIKPIKRGGLSSSQIDALNRTVALAVVDRFSANQIRAQGIANLHRWKAQDSWVSAYQEWLDILQSADDGKLFATMLGRDEESTRLRQSPPYVGLLPQEEVRAIHEKAAA